ncbi:hypothetical protein HPB47_021907, partial [Ixodes persulcatus]
MPFCAVGGCFTKQGDGKRLLRFPLAEKDRERLRAWLELVDRENFQTTPHSRICEEQQCNGQQCMHQATVTELQRKLNLQQQKIRKLEKKLEVFLGSRHENLTPEQQISTMNIEAHGNRWRNDTVQNVWMRCESRKDEPPKDEVIPLISERTLQRQIEEIQSEPEIHEERLPALQSKRQTTSPEERHRTLMVNEMRLNAGLDFDTTVKKP